MEKQLGPRTIAGSRIAIFTVVVQVEFGESWQELDQVQPALDVSFSNLLLRYVMAAGFYSRADAFHVQLGAT
jgi:hypothetical protein